MRSGEKPFQRNRLFRLDGNTGVSNIDVNAGGLLLLLVQLALRIVFRDTDEGKHTLRVNLIDDDGQSLLPGMPTTPLEIRMPENQFFASVNLVFNLQGMRFTKPGQYSLDITLDGTMIARIPLQVLLMPSEGGPPN